MSKKKLGIVLIIVGLVAVAVSLGADAIGIGTRTGSAPPWSGVGDGGGMPPRPRIGLRQGLGAAAGVIIAAVGVWMRRGEKQ